MDPTAQNPTVPNQVPPEVNSVSPNPVVVEPVAPPAESVINNPIPNVVQNPTVQPVSQTEQIPSPTVGTTNVVYASFGKRFLALIIDTLILELISFVVSMFLGKTSSNGFSLTGAPAYFVYFLYDVFNIFLIVKFGKTLGKMAMKIKIVDVNTNNIPSIGNVILREVIGKFLSSIALSLGYLWMLWDPKKQTWHDKIAKTVVIKE